MAYLDTRPMTPARLSSIGLVVGIHAVLLYALVTGTYRQVIEDVTGLTVYAVPITVPPKPVEPAPLPKQSKTQPQVVVPETRVATQNSTPVDIVTTPVVPTVYNDGPPTPVIAPTPPATPVTPTPEPASVAVGAKQRGGSISNDDYPPAAIRAGDQGRSTATYTVDAGGRVSSCSATGAGSTLDAETCKLIERRFRFAPAKDAGGSPVAETKTQTIAWRLPQ